MEAALRLAVSVVRTMKQQQLNAKRQWHESQQQSASTSSKPQPSKPCTSRCSGQCTTFCSTTTVNAPANTDCWVGHPLDPIGSLFDTLADASVIPEDQRPRTPSYLGEISNFTFYLRSRDWKINVFFCFYFRFSQYGRSTGKYEAKVSPRSSCGFEG